MHNNLELKDQIEGLTKNLILIKIKRAAILELKNFNKMDGLKMNINVI